ncbi:alpha-1-acid glycoprotein 1 isoform X2 [Microtus oregoni]|uniref:alpha-1-acid glycoprotein 1 isoform X2 n=1 Tax=Microtus oregoni TaxID=111838 RepID=UPI001BB1E2D0|nr:alpha-1-acid glycoprotein 1 isoform X2 [Microtus oregoni]
MVLHVVLVILSLLPLLEAQNPDPANITGTAITNDTLIWLSGKWFYIGSALRNPTFKQEAQKIQAEYFYFTPNLTDDTLLLQEYQTTEDRCVFNSSKLEIQRENGMLSKFGESQHSCGRICLWGRLEGAEEHVAHLKVFMKHRGFMLAFALEDKKIWGLSLYANKPDTAPELLEEFLKAVKSLGMDESEIIYTDWKKDMCSQQQQQREPERKKTEEGP